MSERVFNLFLFCSNGIITELGVASHLVTGSDLEKLASLKARVETDFKTSQRYPVPDRYHMVLPSGVSRRGMLPLAYYQQMVFDEEYLDVFEEVFESLSASDDPIVCITPIVMGQPCYEVAVMVTEGAR